MPQPSRPPKLLIANRGEVAVRVARAADALELPSVAVFARDDAGAAHVGAAETAQALPGEGPAAYLDRAALVAAGLAAGATHVHPGWGFLSEDAAFARACAAAGLTWAGPSPEVLDLLGDKGAARAAAARAGVPVLPSTGAPASLAEATAFLAEQAAPIMLKAVAGGGGRGMRAVPDAAALPSAWERCQAEASLATGSPALYAERLLVRARHVEVQVLGDGSGAVVLLGDRDCSVQRRHQKLVEIAPAPGLEPDLRAALHDAARGVATLLPYAGLGTVEFLLDLDDPGRFFFIEANPRLQVEHTATEAVTGTDLVQAQLRVALGASLAEVGLDPDAPPASHGCALQVRVNAEHVLGDGGSVPTGGRLTALTLPTGDGVRVDTAAAAGAEVSTAYDSLLAKVIVHVADRDLARAAGRAAHALEDLVVEGVETNAAFLARLLDHPDLRAGRLSTGFIGEHLMDLVDAPPDGGAAAVAVGGTVPLESPLTGVVLEALVADGDEVHAGAPVLVLEAMKMHHEVLAPATGVVRGAPPARGAHLQAGALVLTVEVRDLDHAPVVAEAVAARDLDEARPDLAEVLARRANLTDAARPEAIAKRHALGRRSTRENLEDLLDPGSFSEYGGLVVAAQRARRTPEELIARTQADGIITGIGGVNGALVGEDAARCAVLAYDYTVMAGTQGIRSHRKTDRMLEVIERLRVPVVLFAEGGGGRPGDTEMSELFQLIVPTFRMFAQLSGLVPRIGVVSGRCFAGNASLLGCCDVIVATPDATVGMGGPAMIAGGGLGHFSPEEVGPVDVLEPAGVLDVVAADEAEAVDVARRLVGYFQGPVAAWTCADQRLLRDAIPEDPKRVHDARRVVELLFDTGSVTELRRGFGRTVITALARIEGRPVGVVANDPAHLSGALDADGCDKAARFLQLCDAFGLPVVSLVDTPGFMVGPESEKTAMIRHTSRLFTTGATLSVPFIAVVVRRAFGLGAQAMAAGHLFAPALTIAWPTGEFGAMGVEGAVRLALRKELEAIADETEREARVRELVALAREQATALNMAAHGEIDDVIDPVDTRARIVATLRSAPPSLPGPDGRRRTMVDAW